MNAQALFEHAVDRAKAYRDEVLLARDRAQRAGLRSETAAPDLLGRSVCRPEHGQGFGTTSNRERV